MDMLTIDGLLVFVARKNIKHMYLRISANEPQIKVSAPNNISDEAVIHFVLSKRNWIEKQLGSFAAPQLPQPRFANGETVLLFGQIYQLKIIPYQRGKKPSACGNTLFLPAGKTTWENRKKALFEYYRQQLNIHMAPLVSKWEHLIGVEANEVRIKNMRTKWGTCNIRDKRIWLNLQLAKKSVKCVEYVVVHELIHLLEPRHNARFYAYMDKFLPDWKTRKQELNRT